MKYKRIFVLLFSFIFFGCAGLQINNGKEKILQFSITPEKIRPGAVVIVTVKTTEDIKKVYGYLDVPGSPKIPLKYNKKKKIWEFKYMLPLTVVLPKGEFTAKVEAIADNNKKYITEKKIKTY